MLDSLDKIHLFYLNYQTYRCLASVHSSVEYGLQNPKTAVEKISRIVFILRIYFTFVVFFG
jgi:hypothetical protein